MSVRPAETKDIPAVARLFIDLLDYLKAQNPGYNLSSDRDKVVGGALRLIVAKMSAPGHVVLVLEDEEGQVTHFGAGGVTRLPEFCEHEIIGELNWLYPLTVQAKQVLVAFDTWAKEQGATGRWGFAGPENKTSQAAMLRDKMQLELLQYFKPYHKE